MNIKVVIEGVEMKKKWFISILILLSLISCKQENNDGGIRYYEKNKKTRIGYFPEDKNDIFTEIHLISFKEPSLYEFSNDDKNIVFRCLVLGTFTNPYLFRIKKNQDGTGTIFFKLTDGQYTIEGELIEEEKIHITRKELNKFLKMIERNNFWDMESNKNYDILDGTVWVFEGVKDGNYHIITSNDPSRKLGKIYWFLRKHSKQHELIKSYMK